ncbi:MAG: MTH1187 family thiamine-binding protein [Bacillaceae bacterium]|nr:MTH1187 family thiamine-binding protein [Bacillaceae bacterium]
MPLLEISVVPVGTETTSFSSHVTNAVSIIKEMGLTFEVTPTATVIEGELDELMEVAKLIHRNELNNGTKRVITNISIDDRIDKPISLKEQVEIIQETLQ